MYQIHMVLRDPFQDSILKLLVNACAPVCYLGILGPFVRLLSYLMATKSIIYDLKCENWKRSF